MQKLNVTTRQLVAGLAMIWAIPALGGMYKCSSDKGVVYQDHPCTSGVQAEVTAPAPRNYYEQLQADAARKLEEVRQRDAALARLGPMPKPDRSNTGPLDEWLSRRSCILDDTKPGKPMDDCVTAEKARLEAAEAKSAKQSAAWAEYQNAESARMARPGARIGMTESEVREKTYWGPPNSINRTTTAAGIREQWVYNVAGVPSRFLYFTNGVLTAIQQ